MKTKINIPFFSIIIPTLNEQHYLPFLLKDLTRQTFTDFEVIIVDAHSKDKTKVVAEKFREKFKAFKFLTSSKENVSFQRNLGAKEARANWLIFLDADSRIPFYFLQGIKFHVEMSNPDILSTWFEPDIKNSKDKAITTLVNLYIDFQKTSKRPSVLESFLCIKKASFNKLKGFNELILWGEGSNLLERAKRAKMTFSFVRNPRYRYSFRRLRKEGTLKVFRKIAQLELSRLRNIKIPQEEVKYLYPMEGGDYFNLNKTNRGRIKKFFSILIRETKTQVKNNHDSLINKIIKRLTGRS